MNMLTTLPFQYTIKNYKTKIEIPAKNLTGMSANNMGTSYMTGKNRFNFFVFKKLLDYYACFTHGI